MIELNEHGAPGDHTFDDIELGGGIRWVPYHSWGTGTDQIDARLFIGDKEMGLGLDFWTTPAIMASNGLSDKLLGAEICSLAEKAWYNGEVYIGSVEVFGATTLVVPTDENHLTFVLVYEALHRFRP